MDILSYLLGRKSTSGKAEIESDSYEFIDENNDGNVEIQEVE